MDERSDSRAFKVAVAVAFIALITACSIELSGPKRLESVSQVNYDQFVDGAIRISDVVVPAAPTMPVRSHVPRVRRAQFSSQMNQRVKGNCFPSGLRVDFCHRYGRLDTSPSLYSLIPSCRKFPFSQFLGGCRHSRDRVIDYCVSTADVNWDLCRQQQTDCTLTSIAQPNALYRISNASSPVVRVDVNTTIGTGITSFVVDLLVNPHFDGAARSGIIASPISLNSLFGFSKEVAVTVDSAYEGYSPVHFEFSVNASDFHPSIHSVDILFVGVPLNSSVIVTGAYTSTCRYDAADVTLLVPECIEFPLQLAGTMTIDLRVPDGVTEGGAVYGGGLLTAALSSNETLQEVESMPYILLLLSPVGYSVAATLASLGNRTVDGTLPGQRPRHHVVFLSDTAYYDFSVPANVSQKIIIPTVLLPTLQLGWYYAIHFTAKIYGLHAPGCAGPGAIMFNDSTTDQIFVYTNISIDLSDGLLNSYWSNPLNMPQFTIRKLFSIATDDITRRRSCTPVFIEHTSFEPLYVLVTSPSVLGAGYSLTDTSTLTGSPVAVVVALIGTIWDAFIRPSYALGSIDIAGFVCTTSYDVTEQFLKSQATAKAINSLSRLYVPDGWIPFRPPIIRSPVFTDASFYINEPPTGVNARIAVFPPPKQPSSLDARTECDINAWCGIPYDLELSASMSFATALAIVFPPGVYNNPAASSLTAVGMIDGSLTTSTPINLDYSAARCTQNFSFVPFGCRQYPGTGQYCTSSYIPPGSDYGLPDDVFGGYAKTHYISFLQVSELESGVFPYVLTSTETTSFIVAGETFIETMQVPTQLAGLLTRSGGIVSATLLPNSTISSNGACLFVSAAPVSTISACAAQFHSC